MKQLIIAGVILFFFLVGNTVIAQTCRYQGEVPYESAEHQLALVINQTENLNSFDQAGSLELKQQALNGESNEIKNQIEQLNQILQNYQQVSVCSSYYVDAERKIPQVQAYLERLRPMVN